MSSTHLTLTHKLNHWSLPTRSCIHSLSLGEFILPIAQTKNPGVILDGLLLLNPTPNPSANLVDSTFKAYLEFTYFSSSHCFHPGASHHHLLSGLSKETHDWSFVSTLTLYSLLSTQLPEWRFSVVNLTVSILFWEPCNGTHSIQSKSQNPSHVLQGTKWFGLTITFLIPSLIILNPDHSTLATLPSLLCCQAWPLLRAFAPAIPSV